MSLAVQLIIVMQIVLSGVGLPIVASQSPQLGAIPVKDNSQLTIERITTAVPWPRGIRFVDGKLYALARGVHRSAGGPNSEIEDLAGSIFEIDPNISEAALSGSLPGSAIRSNAKIIAPATGHPFRIWNRQMPATLDTKTDRPYCMLAYDPVSKNFFICGYSGIDLAGKKKFRKNASDSVLRFDMRDKKWRIVDSHNPEVVPVAELGKDVDSSYYPHHDPKKNAPPHGLVNGPCGAIVAGQFLYVGAKDNSSLAQYDLSDIQKNSAAKSPRGRYIFEGSKGSAFVEVKGHGKMKINGTCAVTAHGGFLYVAFRTTSQILRFPLEKNGDIAKPMVAEYVAQFPEYDAVKKKGSANIYDMIFDKEGRCYVSPGYDGSIYRFKPNPDRVFDAKSKKYEPYVDLQALVGCKKTGNICFDDRGNLYICCGQKVDPSSKTRGVIYRIAPQP